MDIIKCPRMPIYVYSSLVNFKNFLPAFLAQHLTSRVKILIPCRNLTNAALIGDYYSDPDPMVFGCHCNLQRVVVVSK